jgi:hypothetical protein
MTPENISYNKDIDIPIELFTKAFYRSLSRSVRKQFPKNINSFLTFTNGELYRLGKNIFHVGINCRVYNIKTFIEQRDVFVFYGIKLNENFYNKFEEKINNIIRKGE